MNSMTSPMNSMAQMNGGFQLHFQGSGAGTPASCTPGNTPFGSNSFHGNFFGMQTMAGSEGCTPMAMSEGVAAPTLPPWPPESSFSFPPVTFVGASAQLPGTLPQFQESTSGPCASPKHFAQGGCQGLSPGASPMRNDCPPVRHDCPGTPEQYASYPMPS